MKASQDQTGIRFRAACGVAIALFSALPAMSGCGGRSAIERTTVFYPPVPQSPKLQFLTRFANSKDLGVEVGGFRKFVTGEKARNDELVKPHQVAFTDGKIYVCDSRRGEIIVMDMRKKEMSVLGKLEGFTFGKPLSVAVAPDGKRYIADNVKKRVFVFDENDHFQRSFGEDGQFGPTSVGVYADRLFVTDVDNHELEVLNRHTGEVIRTTRGSEESATGYLLMPANLAVDSQGHVYVSDLLAANIHEFDSDLNFIRNIGRQGDQLGRFTRPRGIAVDRDGFLYVADAGFENVQVFSNDGALALFFGGPGLGEGQMYLPSGVTISYDGLDLFKRYVDDRFEIEYLVFVANQYGPNGVSVYGFGHGKKGYFSETPPSPEAGREAPPEGDE